MDLRAASDHLLNEGAARVKQVFAVVQDQQQIPRCELLCQCYRRVRPSGKSNPQRRCDRGCDDLGILNSRQLHQPDSVWEVIAGGRTPGQLQSKPALANTAYTCQGEQPGTPEASGKFGDQTAAADETSGRLWQIVRGCGCYWLAAGEQPPVKGFGFRFRFGGVLLLKPVAEPLVHLDGFPPPTETGERVDYDPVEALVQRARGGEGFQEGEGGFWIALLGQLGAKQDH